MVSHFSSSEYGNYWHLTHAPIPMQSFIRVKVNVPSNCVARCLIFEGQAHWHNIALFLVLLSCAKWKTLNSFGYGRINHYRRIIKSSKLKMKRSLVHSWSKASEVEDRAYARWITVFSKQSLSLFDLIMTLAKHQSIVNNLLICPNKMCCCIFFNR